MPLITCPDCKNQISDTAPTCPHCGRPISNQISKSGAKISAFRIAVILLPILIIICAGIVFYLYKIRLYENENKYEMVAINQQQKDFAKQQNHQQNEQKIKQQENKKQTEELQEKQKELEEQQRIKEEEIQQKQKEIEEQQRKQKEELIKAKVQDATNSLTNEMLQTAMTEAKPRHPASNITECSAADKNITKQDESVIEFSILFKCHMVGGIIGMHSFDVGVNVRGQIAKNDDSFTGSVLGAYVEYDNRQ